MQLIDKKTSDECLFRIRAARTRLIINHGFFGVISNKLQLKEDNSISTAATDGVRLYYSVDFIMGVSDDRRAEMHIKAEEHITTNNIDVDKSTKIREQVDAFCDGLTDPEVVFLIVHEILHCAYAHMIRRGDRDASLWNMACDFAINQIIVREGIGSMPRGGLLEDRFNNMSADEIYNILVDEGAEPQDTLDEHMDGSEGGNGDSNGDSRGNMNDILGKDTASSKNIDSDDIIDAIEDFQETMKSASASCSDTPDSIRKMIDKLSKPVIDWRPKVHKTMKSHIKSNSSFSHPSRRGHVLTNTLRNTGALCRNQSIILPGLIPEDTIDIAIGLDTSGSISEHMLHDFISEVISITKMFSTFRILLFCWDTEVHNPQVFTQSNASEMASYELQGWGGTTVGSCFEFFKESNKRPNQFICFTDGYFFNEELTQYENITPTLFVVHTNPDFNAPFGESIPYTWDKESA